ncbi:uncharacterized protein LOC143459513 [Clavelina lepadiformis]|uniref:uncharacterized protein LOC143459513 n=1 Tax=Clavelina lepadiformis TaxID=159417 RepID=UPI004042F612
MIAALNMHLGLGAQSCPQNSTRRSCIQRRTSFFIRDILGSGNEMTSDDDAEEECHSVAEKEVDPKGCIDHLEKAHSNSSLEENRIKQMAQENISPLSCRECCIRADISSSDEYSFKVQERTEEAILTQFYQEEKVYKNCNTEIEQIEENNSSSSSSHDVVSTYKMPSVVDTGHERNEPSPTTGDLKKCEPSSTPPTPTSHLSEDWISRDSSFMTSAQKYASDSANSNVMNMMREPTRYNIHPYNELVVNPALMDMRYAYYVRAASLAMPPLPFNLVAYPAHVDPLASTHNEALSKKVGFGALHSPLLSVSTSAAISPRQEPYPSSRISEWRKKNNIHSNIFLNRNSTFSRRTSSSPHGSDVATYEAATREDRGLSPGHSVTPSSSVSSSSSLSPEKKSVQLPAYLRSRLGGGINSDTSGTGEIGKSKKCRRSRTVFTELQMLGLEKRFEKQQYLSTPDRVELAELLSLTQLQVKTWYQNRRMKWKKQVLQGGGTEPPTKPKGRPRKVRPEEQAVSKPLTSLPITPISQRAETKR